MLRYFRINDPYRLLTLLGLLAIASLPLLIDLPGITMRELKDVVLGEVVGSRRLYVEIVDRTPPLMAVMDSLLNFMFGRSLMARHILAFFIIFFQASYFGILLINNKAYNESNYVTTLIFGFLCFFSFDLMAATPELFASTLLLLALNNLFKEIEFRVDRDSVVLNLGVFLGLASLFVFSYTVFLFGTILILLIFAKATVRKILLLLFGYGLVHAGLIILYYCYGNVSDLWQNFYRASIEADRMSVVGFRSLLVLGAMPGAYFIFSLFMLTREARLTRYQSQLFQSIFLWLAIAIIQVWLTPEVTPHSFFTFIPAAAYFISHYLLVIRRKWRAEVMLWLFIFGVLTINYTTRHGMIEQVNFSSLFVKPSPYREIVSGKKIMILGNDISLYEQNKLAGYFFDWDLSKAYFEQPLYYENVIKINQSFKRDLPDAIVDPNGIADPIIERIPALKNNYRKEKGIYWKR